MIAFLMGGARESKDFPFSFFFCNIVFVFDVNENLWPIEKRKRRDGGSVTCRNPSPDNNLWSPKSQIRKTTK